MRIGISSVSSALVFDFSGDVIVMSCLEVIGTQISPKRMKNFEKAFRESSVTVTGGASFIGSHLVDALVELGANVTVVDDFSSGRMSNLTPGTRLSIREGDLRDLRFAHSAIGNPDYLFHLAAIHGGRGFIETQQSAILANLAIDNNVFNAGLESAVAMIIHASSACAYPVGLQDREDVLLLLSEDEASMETAEKSFPDGVYGWIKLLGEYQLATMVRGSKTRGRSARIFTAYGERENESHAAVALMAKALLKMDPYPIWGSGQQTRNFTYVADTICGLLMLACDERPEEFDAVNVGTAKHSTVIEFVKIIFNELGWEPAEMHFQLDRPVGVASRASNNDKSQALFGWSPSVALEDGIRRTLAWYAASEKRPRSETELEALLLAR